METVEQTIATTRTQSGHTLGELSATRPVLVVFLRHSGCPYCRQTLSTLASLRETFAKSNTQLVIVHHDTPERGEAWIGKYNLGDSEQISDPDGQLYAKFDLGKTTWWNLAGPHTWWPGFKATILQFNGVGIPVGDVKQLTGAFLIHHGRVVKSFRQKLSSDSPDYRSMVCEL
ncbi:MAG: redoxin domain-containing protein [Pirellulaceae bacterium]|nr:redoxin domain-containing protein [Pirellulaceae bacterium]